MPSPGTQRAGAQLELVHTRFLLAPLSLLYHPLLSGLLNSEVSWGWVCREEAVLGALLWGSGIRGGMCGLSRFSRARFFATLWTVARQAPLSMGSSRQEYWSGLPCPPLEYLPDPGIEPVSLTSPVLAGMFVTTSATPDTNKMREGVWWESMEPLSVGQADLVASLCSATD